MAHGVADLLQRHPTGENFGAAYDQIDHADTMLKTFMTAPDTAG